jgi:hypothetical protein
MTGILFIGFLASLLMQDIPLQNVMDEKWGLEQPAEAKTSEDKV